MAVAYVGFNQRTTTGTSVNSPARTFAAGSYGLVISWNDNNANNNLTFSGGGLTYNEIATADITNNGDYFNQEAAWFYFAAGGSLTVTATTPNSPWQGICLVELTGVSGYDTASYLRTTSSPNCGSLSNTNAAATRVACGISWGTGTLDNVSGYTDEGSGGAYGGTPTMRVSSLVETAVTARTSAFSIGTATSPFHCTQFIFSDTGGGGGGLRRKGSLALAGVGR